ncbi:hypothetical protein B0J17DRAFT_657784 [Rhizoctonia solani]|nr:hypothetical protein B0J17DRAFT_657784 [Rhizoctonia solani]
MSTRTGYRVDLFAKTIAPESIWLRFLILWYMVPFAWAMFFAFLFGLGQEAKDEYTKCIDPVRAKVLRVKPNERTVLPISLILLTRQLILPQMISNRPPTFDLTCT